MRSLQLLAIQYAYENVRFWRNSIAAFFTVALPILMMMILCLLFGSQQTVVEGQPVYWSTFYVPSLSAMAVIGACFTNIAMEVSISRDRGLLKRYRGTPLPVSILVCAKLVHAVVLGFLLVICLIGVGVWVFDASVNGIQLSLFVVALILGSITFCALGLAVAALIPNAEASPAIVQAVVLPLLFISDVFLPMDNAPAWLQWIASVFPVRHFALILQSTFHPILASDIRVSIHLFVMAAWFAVGLVVAIRYFRWEPRR
ncbi:MAG: ABC transporter permease [Gammaproteobacteria bacterium]|nr:ABC transporter permease [Gammaproteobacteria bacterium]